MTNHVPEITPTFYFTASDYTFPENIFSFTDAQKRLTQRTIGVMISINLLYGKCVRAERVVGTKTAESCRVVRGNSRESDEVHSVSSVLKASRHNGCDRYIAEAFQAGGFPYVLRSQ